MFLSAPLPVPQEFITRTKVLGAPSVPNAQEIGAPAPKTWVQMSQIIPATCERLLITVSRAYSSASAETGFIINRASDGLRMYDVNPTSKPNTHDTNTHEIQRPAEGWGALKIYINTSGAGTIRFVIIHQLANLYS
ncbi:hypothetical protein NVP1020O_20 [Vibrio phage 1.020.O._10N.222.48.A2]|uniref:Uncharacterized protein n=1 Tax=Vibrio phage 1.020.O._10N.222.48.A2 TaxID=1881450 RepID=A0A2I7QKY8_9VIRU|nr:hypothetical protein KMD66_gp20 [Vibrio phage 1.020.O._10N.222.48.A2]AUR82062.1 hypothetical protein NVP1020O_20 [Vibrio phage 1.020.O._10N.222.48.A2]